MGVRAKKNTEGKVQREYARIYATLNETEVIAFERVKARKRRKRQLRRRLVLVGIMLLCGVILYGFLPISRVQTVNVYQNKIVDTATILAQSRIKEGESFLLLLFDSFVANNVQENPFIDSVTIEKNMNGTVNITVQERWVVYKTKKDDDWLAYFNDGSSVVIPAGYDVDASVLISVPSEVEFPYAELAQNLAYVPREIIDKISEIKHNPSNLDTWRFMFYMNDRNRVSVLMPNIKRMMKYYDKLVENSNNERFEYVMEYTQRGIIGRKIDN
jgi:cell division septal protein FtsQ